MYSCAVRLHRKEPSAGLTIKLMPNRPLMQLKKLSNLESAKSLQATLVALARQPLVTIARQPLVMLRASCLKLEINEFRCYEAFSVVRHSAPPVQCIQKIVGVGGCLAVVAQGQSTGG